jgi:hypothetical protein
MRQLLSILAAAHGVARSGPASCPRLVDVASAAAMPPSAMTVCALPSSDLQTRPTGARRRGLDGGAQAGAAGADHDHVDV